MTTWQMRMTGFSDRYLGLYGRTFFREDTPVA